MSTYLLDGHVGVIDTKGNWILEPVYDDIGDPVNGGYRKLTQGDLMGLLTRPSILSFRCNMTMSAYQTEESHWLRMVVSGCRTWKEMC